MILQALVKHYEDLAAQGEIAKPGWGQAKVSFALCLDDTGTLTQVISLKTEQPQGKKTALLPQSMELPAPEKRTVGVKSNFLWDNSSYLLGADNKDNPQRTAECFSACRQRHKDILENVDSPAARAVLAFFQNWEPSKAPTHPALAACWEELTAGTNLVFYYDGAYVHTDPAVQAAWQAYYDGEESGEKAICLVTGQETLPEAVHPSIKGVQGAQSSGAALVSFNAPAFCSYGKEQNLNAPVGKYAAFAYTTALNHLLSDREHVCRVGDTTVVCWAEGGDPAYQGLFGGYTFGQKFPYSQDELRDMVRKLLSRSGEPVIFDGTRLDPDRPFYILGLAPNAARLSVRFFLRNSFGGFLENTRRHYARLEIVKPAYEKFETLPLWKLLDETVNQSSRDKSPAPGMAGAVLRAILNDAPYPATLLNGVALRIRAERKVTWGRAAILKAYYTKNPRHTDVPEEVLTVSLNENSTNVPYTLGRLFSVLEAIQSTANPGISATIKDKYFNSASATPSRVFPLLTNLAQKHLRKLEGGQKVYYDKQLTALMSILGESYPDHLSLPQQGAFQLGYYHQTQKRYEKKEET